MERRKCDQDAIAVVGMQDEAAFQIDTTRRLFLSGVLTIFEASRMCNSIIKKRRESGAISTILPRALLLDLGPLGCQRPTPSGRTGSSGLRDRLVLRLGGIKVSIGTSRGPCARRGPRKKIRARPQDGSYLVEEYLERRGVAKSKQSSKFGATSGFDLTRNSVIPDESQKHVAAISGSDLTTNRATSHEFQMKVRALSGSDLARKPPGLDQFRAKLGALSGCDIVGKPRAR